jgi:hypothetical protein
MSLVPGRTAEYRKRLNDPGKRSTIPDAYLRALSPALFSRRQQNQRNTYNLNTLYNPSVMLSGPSLKNAASSLAGLEINPQEAEIRRQQALTRANYDALGSRVSGYNKLLTDALGASATQAHQTQANVATGLADAHSAALGSVDQTFQNSQNLLNQDSALRGGGQINDATSQRLATEFQQQRQSVDAQMQANQNQGNAVGQGFANLADLMKGVGALRAADAQTQAANAGANAQAELTGKMTDLEAQRGGLIAKNTQDLRQSQFENSVTAQTLGIKQQDATTAAARAAQDAQNKQLDRGIKRQQLRDQENWHSAQNQLREDLARLSHGDRSASLQEQIKHDRAMEQNARDRLNKTTRKDKSPYTFLPEVTHAREVNLFNQLKGSGALADMIRKGKSRQEIAQTLLASRTYGGSPAIISAALDAAMTNHLSDATVRKLHDAGIRVGKLGVKTAKELRHRPKNGVLYDRLPTR